MDRHSQKGLTLNLIFVHCPPMISGFILLWKKKSVTFENHVNFTCILMKDILGIMYHCRGASMVALMVRTCLQCRRRSGFNTWVAKAVASHSGILAWRIPMDRGASGTTGVASGHDGVTNTNHHRQRIKLFPP